MTAERAALRFRLATILITAAAVSACSVLDGRHSNVEKVAGGASAQEGRIQQLERFLQEHPGYYDWYIHYELRHLYIGNNLEESHGARRYHTNLLMKSQPFPDLRFLAAACFLKIGDLYAMDGNAEMAEDSYRKVATIWRMI